MGFLDDLLVRDLLRRAGQEWESQDKDTVPNPLGGGDLHYNPLRNVPLVGGIINRTVNAPLHAIGMVNEGAEKAAQAIAGEMVMAAALPAALAGDPDNPNTQAAREVVGNGPLHPGRAIERARTVDNKAISYGAGALEMVANPLNVAGPIAKAGEAMQAAGKVGALGRALATVGRVGEAANEAQMLPVAAAFPSARRALLDAMFPRQGASEAIRTAATPAVLDALGEQGTARAARQTPSQPAGGSRGGVPLTEIPEVGGQRQYGPVPTVAASDALRARIMGEAGENLPLAPKARNYNAYARESGLPTLPAQVEPDPSSLVPRNFSILRAAKERQPGGQLPLREASTPVTPESIATSIAPEIAPDPPSGAIGQARTVLPETVQNPSETNNLDKLRNLLLSGDGGRGMVYPPNDPAFYTKRTGIPAEEVPSLLRQLETEGIIGRDLDGGMILRPKERPGLPPEAITPEQEAAAAADWYGAPQSDPVQASAAAPDLPQSSLADLSDDEIMTLVEVGYGTQEAVANALAKRKDPMLLAGRAIERITTDRRKLAALTSAHPDLAEKLAYLDLPGETKPPTPTALPLGGDIAAGGDKLIAPRLAPTAIGALAGGATGAAVGAATNEDDRLGGGLKGAGIGAVAGGNLGSVSPEIAQLARQLAPGVAQSVEGSWLDPAMIGDILTVMKREQLAHGNEAGNVRGLKDAWDAFWQQWRSQAVNTPKQFSTDAASRKLVMEGIAKQEFPGYDDQGIRDWQKLLSHERVNGVTSLSNPLVQKFVALGQQDLLPILHDIYGLDFVADATKSEKRFGPAGRAIAGAIRGTFDGARTMNPAMPLVGAARGYFDTAVAAGIQHGNGIQHDAARFAMGDSALVRDIPALANDFLGDLAARGVDTTALEAKGGWFSPAEVAAIAGKQAGADWKSAVEGTIRAQGDRIAFLNGDFRDKLDPKYTGKVTTGDKIVGTAEKAIGKYIPFARWQLRYAPVLAEIATRHPRAAALVAAQIVHGAEQAKEDHLRPYEANTIPVSTEAPVAGALARALLGGQKGTARIDPLGTFIPFGAEALMGDDGGTGQKTAYQNATGALARVGFSPAPPIQAAAYALGQDYKSPGALSRTAGIEKAASLIPGMPELPSGSAAIDIFRSIAEPLIGKVAPTAGKTSEYDPIARRYAELVLAKTGKTLDDEANRQYLVTMHEGDPLYDQARREVLVSGAVKNVASLGNPVGTTTQGADAATNRAAKEATPFTREEIARMAASPTLQAAMQAQNDRYSKANPQARAYTVANQSGREKELLEEFDARASLLKRYNPAGYAKAKAEFLASLR